MDEAVAKFTRFKNLVKTLPGMPATYLVAFSSTTLETFLGLIRTTYEEKQREGSLNSTDPKDIALQILVRLEVAVDKMEVADLYRFTQYVEYFLCLALA